MQKPISATGADSQLRTLCERKYIKLRVGDQLT